MSAWQAFLRKRWTQRSWPAGKAFAWLVSLFGLAFLAQIFWLAATSGKCWRVRRAC
jgi:hypothetical protein